MTSIENDNTIEMCCTDSTFRILIKSPKGRQDVARHLYLTEAPQHQHSSHWQYLTSSARDLPLSCVMWGRRWGHLMMETRHCSPVCLPDCGLCALYGWAAIYLSLAGREWLVLAWVFLAKLITLAFSVNIVLRLSQDSCQQAYLIISDFKFVSDIDKAKLVPLGRSWVCCEGQSCQIFWLFGPW